MLGAVLGGMIWILFFVVVGIGFFGLFNPGMWGVLEILFTWVQVPVVGVAVVSLYEDGIPGGVGELKSALEWVSTQDPDEEVNYQEMPANTMLVGLELAAATLASVGLIFSAFFSMGIAVTTVGAFGMALYDPTQITFLGISPPEAFALFLAGGILWQIALFLEALET